MLLYVYNWADIFYEYTLVKDTMHERGVNRHTTPRIRRPRANPEDRALHSSTAPFSRNSSRQKASRQAQQSTTALARHQTTPKRAVHTVSRCTLQSITCVWLYHATACTRARVYLYQKLTRIIRNYGNGLAEIRTTCMLDARTRCTRRHPCGSSGRTESVHVTVSQPHSPSDGPAQPSTTTCEREETSASSGSTSAISLPMTAPLSHTPPRPS